MRKLEAAKLSVIVAFWLIIVVLVLFVCVPLAILTAAVEGLFRLVHINFVADIFSLIMGGFINIIHCITWKLRGLTQRIKLFKSSV